jgi:hypothetical protein
MGLELGGFPRLILPWLLPRMFVSLFPFMIAACSDGDAQPATDTFRDASVVDNESGTASDSGSEQGDADGPWLGCSPGEKLNPFDRSVECRDGFCICRTYAPDGGTLIPLMGRNMGTSVISMRLPQPMRAGQPYSFAVMLTNSNYTGDVELWGANSECGAGLERLVSEPFASKVYCAEVVPAQDYTHVFFVRQYTGIADGSFAGQFWDNFIACPNGSCP